MKAIILASQSPRRQQLLATIVESFASQAADIDEERLRQEILNESFQESTEISPMRLVKGLAQAKARAILSLHPEGVTIGADTLIATKNGEIIGKPENETDAQRTLQRLSKDGYHKVYTGISIQSQETSITFADSAKVYFNPLDNLQEQLIQEYVDTGSPLDKAGSYSIGDQGALLIQKIDGDYYTILGLPVAKVYRQLVSHGFL